MSDVKLKMPSKAKAFGLAAFALSCYLLLVSWIVYSGYQSNEASQSENLQQILRENNVTNRLLLSGHINLLRQTSEAYARLGSSVFPLTECDLSNSDDCLFGLVSSAELTITQPENLDCGQTDLLKTASLNATGPYQIGSTTWMSEGFVMAPIAHRVPGSDQWIAACFVVDSIRDIWRDLGLPAGSAMALIRGTDYRLWIREPFRSELLGRDLSAGPLVGHIQNALPERAGIGDIIATHTDSVARTVQWAPIGVDDLILVAGYPRDYYWSSWLQSEKWHLILVAVLTVALGGTSGLAVFLFYSRYTKVTELAERLDLAATAGKIGIWEYQLDSGRLLWNPEMFHIYGVSPDSFKSNYSDWRTRVHPEDLESAEGELAGATTKNAVFESTFRILTPSGLTKYISAAAKVYDASDGKGLIMIGVNMDMTDQVLSTSALERAKLDAESATRSKSMFLANMSHEIRTPLNGILGLSQLLRQKTLAPDIANYIELIHESGNSLLEILNSVLDYSRIEAAAVELKPETFDFVEMCKSLQSIYIPKCHEKSISFELEIADGFDPVRFGDLGKVRQILHNFLNNALKFTDQGHIALTVWGDANSLFVRVSDTGRGMTPEDLNRIFERFAKVDESNTRDTGGAGLGLAITKGLVNLMGGSIDVESVLDGGSIFTIELPIGVADDR